VVLVREPRELADRYSLRFHADERGALIAALIQSRPVTRTCSCGSLTLQPRAPKPSRPRIRQIPKRLRSYESYRLRWKSWPRASEVAAITPDDLAAARAAAPAWPVQLPASVEEAAAELAVSAAPVKLRPKASAGPGSIAASARVHCGAAAGMTLPEWRRFMRGDLALSSAAASALAGATPRGARATSPDRHEVEGAVSGYRQLGGITITPRYRSSSMLIALLAVLGVDLIVIVGVIAVVLSRKRWVMRQPGAFRGAIRVASGEIDGLRPKWRRGYGRWVGEILVWSKAPFLFRNELVVIEGLDEQGPAGPDEIKRLGDHPVIAQLRADNATAEVAARDDDRELLLGPYRTPGAAVVGAQPAPMPHP